MRGYLCCDEGEMRGVWGGAEISCRVLFRGIIKRVDRTIGRRSGRGGRFEVSWDCGCRIGQVVKWFIRKSRLYINGMQAAGPKSGPCQSLLKFRFAI